MAREQPILKDEKMTRRLETNLIGQRVRFNEVVHANVHFIGIEPGETGTIRAAYQVDDTIKFSVELDKSHELYETFTGCFRVLGENEFEPPELGSRVIVPSGELAGLEGLAFDYTPRGLHVLVERRGVAFVALGEEGSQ